MSPITQFRRLARLPFIYIAKILSQQEQTSLKILTQIILVQFAFYFNFLILWKSVSFLLGFSPYDSIFDYTNFTFSDLKGLTNIFCWLINSVLTSFIISVIVGRSKLAWDFALTVHIINIVLSVIYNKSFPTHILWWLIQFISSLLIIFLGTYMSRFRELRDTFFDELLDSSTTSNNKSIEMNDLENQT